MSLNDSQRTPIFLRPLHLDDVDDILAWVNNPTIVGNIAAFSGKPFTRKEELKYVTSMLASENDVAFSIIDDDTQRYLGQIGIHQIHHRSKVGRLGCIVAASQDMGQGVGSSAIQNILKIAFSKKGILLDENTGIEGLGLHKVWLMIFKDNVRSHRTYQRLGFVDEGILREEYFHQDQWHDMVRMSILVDEWKSRQANLKPGETT